MDEWQPYNPGNLPKPPRWKRLGAEVMIKILKRDHPAWELRTREVGLFGKVIIEYRQRPGSKEPPSGPADDSSAAFAPIQQYVLVVLDSLGDLIMKQGIARGDAFNLIAAVAEGLRRMSPAIKGDPKTGQEYIIKVLSDLADEMTQHNFTRENGLNLLASWARLLGQSQGGPPTQR